MGFYTVEIRNLETGTVQSKADLLIMENLFYEQKVSKTFDLKGIQGRKVKGPTSQTLFDGEWIESEFLLLAVLFAREAADDRCSGQQQLLTFIRPHSSFVLREALRGDADFLARSNIMDYSYACPLVKSIDPLTTSVDYSWASTRRTNGCRVAW